MPETAKGHRTYTQCIQDQWIGYRQTKDQFTGNLPGKGIFPTLVTCIALVLLCLSGTQALANSKERFLHISYPGIRFSAERDFGYSPLVYSGLQGSFSLSYETNRPTSSSLFFATYVSGGIANAWGNKMHTQTAGLLTFRFYHNQAESNRSIRWGWSNNNEYNIRRVKDLKNFNDRNEYVTSFGPAAHFQKHLSFFERQFTLEAIAHIQLLGFKMQSSFVTSLPRGFEEPAYTGLDAFFRSIDLFYPGNSINAGIQPALHYYLKSGNALTLGYKYDYLRLQGAHIVEKSRGTWHIGIITQL